MGPFGIQTNVSKIQLYISPKVQGTDVEVHDQFGRSISYSPLEIFILPHTSLQWQN
jgi:hypothetical protein